MPWWRLPSAVSVRSWSTPLTKSRVDTTFSAMDKSAQNNTNPETTAGVERRASATPSEKTACEETKLDPILKHSKEPSVASAALLDEKQLTCTSSGSDLEAQNGSTPTAGSCDEFSIHDLTQKRLGFLRYTALNVYRRLFSIAFVGNAIAFVIVMVKGATALDLVNAAAVNLAVCGLCRQPLVVNALFLAVCAVPRTAPIRLRRLACKLFHIGGVHSGTGIAAVVWYIGFAAVYTHLYVPSPLATAALVLIWLVLAFLLAIVIVAYPSFRFKRHDIFELTHRFSNWAILLCFWALVFVLGHQEPSLSYFLLHLPAFWILILITLATIHPWVLLRRVAVVPEHLSPHAVRLHFNHTKVCFGQGVSIAKHPLRDWHSFASFTDRFDTPDTKFSCLVSKAGDWTRGAIKDQPTHLWVRGIPTYGFGYVLRMFPKIIVVTTGSGIGPCLSFIDDPNRPEMRVIWQTKAPLQTYGARTLDLVRRMDSDPVIMDSSVTGRVNMLPIILKLYREFGAEAVAIISNVKMTKSLVFDLESRGIPALGPIFDS